MKWHLIGLVTLIAREAGGQARRDEGQARGEDPQPACEVHSGPWDGMGFSFKPF